MKKNLPRVSHDSRSNPGAADLPQGGELDQDSPSRLGPSGADPSLLRAIRRRKGRVTVGDVVADTGHSSDEAEVGLKNLLETRQGHLEVGESGTLVYRFDPRLLRRDAEPLATRLSRAVGAAMTKAFKVWIVVMLVVYFVVFVALVIAALLASQSREGGRGRGGSWGRNHRGFGGFGDLWLWYFFWNPGWGRRRRYYGHRWEQKYAKKRGKHGVPFIVKVFSFVFGPDRPQPTRMQKNRSVIRLIRARRGVLTATELVQHTGMTLHEAEEEMARLMAETGGDVRVTKEGVLAYVFPDLMISAGGRVEEREPDPAWRRLEPQETVTGNDKKSNAIIGGMNAFNMVAAGTAPWFIFPRLGLAGDLVWIGLVWIPLVFSSLFFLIPLVRSVAVRRRNELRRGRNVRRVVLGDVVRASLSGKESGWVSIGDARRRTMKALASPDAGNGLLDGAFHDLTAEFDGEVEEDPQSGLRYRFPVLRRDFEEAEILRNRMALQDQAIGDIVYASDQTEEEGHERDLAAFDRALSDGASLDRYLLGPDRIDYLDDFELVAFDEEMKRRQALEA